MYASPWSCPRAAPVHFSLPQLEESGVASVSRLPLSIRILLESVLRNLDGRRIRDEDALALAAWQPQAPRVAEVPFVVGCVLLQDFTGVPLLVDLAAMRSAVAWRGGDIAAVSHGSPSISCSITRCRSTTSPETTPTGSTWIWCSTATVSERYRFLKWGARAFAGLRIVPPASASVAR